MEASLTRLELLRPGAAACLSTLLAGCSLQPPAAGVSCLAARLDEIQVIGSHNSYRVLPPESVLQALETMRPGLRQKLEYEHPPLARQLDLGLRLLELDFYADPDGGLYADPPVLKQLAQGDPQPFDPADLKQPGFKVIHIQGYDIYTHCLELRACLSELRDWSDAHPGHSLITVTLNVKEDRVFEDLPVPPKFDAGLLDDVDRLLLQEFGRQRLLSPDDVRGVAATLRDAVLTNGWPSLGDVRGRFMFVLDEGKPSASLAYRQGHPSLKGRMMFASYPEADDEAAFMVYWDIRGSEETVADLVAKGFLVRVSSDIGTLEARTGDRSRLEAAIASGAQYIATDYYPGHISPFDTTYIAAFDDGSVLRCPGV